MKPETLLSISTAKSAMPIDGGPTIQELAEAGKWFRRGVGKANGSVRWSTPRGSRSTKRAAWSMAECGQACSNLADHVYQAVRFSYALDDGGLWPLRQHLMKFAEARQKIEGWPATVLRLGIENTYLPDLVDMALLEERQPSRFIGGDGVSLGRPANLRPILLGVEPHVWRRQLSAKYETIRTEYGCWLAIGIAHMRRRLREHQ